MMEIPQFHGAWPALITPQSYDLGVNQGMLRDLTSYLLKKGIGGLYLCGSTGEGVFMSVPERKQVTATVMEFVNGRVPVIVHVGANATRDAVDLARHAAYYGAQGVASILPTFGRGIASTYLHYEAIAAAVPDLPFYPYLFGGQLDAIELMRELQTRVPNLAGAKYTGPNMHELLSIVKLNPEWTLFSGMDEQCIFARMVGAKANIGTTLNYMPGVYREIHNAYESGDMAKAQDLQLAANAVTRTLQDFGILGALRDVMRYLGYDCGVPRLPIPPMPEDKREPLIAALQAIGFDQLAAM